MEADSRALLLGLAAVFLWSTVATAFKIALGYLDVFQLLFYACSVSALVLLAVVAARGQAAELPKYFRATPGYFIGVALLNPCLYYLVLLNTYNLLPTQQAQAINYTWAITLSLLAVPVLGQRLSPIDWAAIAVGYSGVLVIATRGDVFSLRFDSPLGVSLALFSTVLWAGYWIINARNRRDPALNLCLNFLLAAPVCLLLCALFSSLKPPPWQGLAAAAYAGMFEMGVTFLLWSAALRRTSRVSRIASLIFLAPFLSLAFISGILGEPIHPATVVGLCLIVPAALYQQKRR